MKQVKQEHYTKEYLHPYYNNTGMIILYKSMRKNSKCIEAFNFCHLIPSPGIEKISDDRIIEQLLNVLEKIIYAVNKESNKEIVIESFLELNKRSSYIDASGNNYNDHEKMTICLQKKHLYSWELLKYLYNMFSLVYPYNTINLSNELWHNKRLKDLLSKL
jgi:hypothetical protein